MLDVNILQQDFAPIEMPPVKSRAPAPRFRKRYNYRFAWTGAAMVAGCAMLAACSWGPQSTGTWGNPRSTSEGQQVAGTAGPAKDWLEYRKRAAARIMQANLSSTYDGKPADMLASIPVLTVYLNADGTVREIQVMRTPKAYPQTVAMAKAAIMRAAPFGSVTHLPRPWSFNETFLYNYDLKFQLHSLQNP